MLFPASWEPPISIDQSQVVNQLGTTSATHGPVSTRANPGAGIALQRRKRTFWRPRIDRGKVGLRHIHRV